MSKDRNTGLPLSEREFFILASLSRGQVKHGYEVGREVYEETSGRIIFSPATLYESLSRILAKGLIKEADAPEDGKALGLKRYYQIDGAGEMALQEHWALMKKAASWLPPKLSGAV